MLYINNFVPKPNKYQFLAQIKTALLYISSFTEKFNCILHTHFRPVCVAMKGRAGQGRGRGKVGVGEGGTTIAHCFFSHHTGNFFHSSSKGTCHLHREKNASHGLFICLPTSSSSSITMSFYEIGKLFFFFFTLESFVLITSFNVWLDEMSFTAFS